MIKRRWTEEDDKTLLSFIESNPNNLKKAFKLTAHKLNRTFNACRYRWYYRLANPLRPEYKGVVFLILNKKAAIANKKNTITNNNCTLVNAKTRRSVWFVLKKLLKFK